MGKLTIPEEEYMLEGHMGCLGCGGTLAMRYLLKALGKDTILSIPACCWAIMMGSFPYTNLAVPMHNSAFEVTGAAISGIEAALKVKGREHTNVVGFAGDGGTIDIGIQSLSGCVERGHNVFYICYDNEAYMNTGIQRSGSTPVGAWTTTTPVGKTMDWKKAPKKNAVEIMVAHKIPYTATASVAYPEDYIKKLRAGKETKGPKYYQVLSPCPTGWKYPPEKTIEVGRLAVQTCIYPLYEVSNGRYNITFKPGKKRPVKEYFETQGRFRHLPANAIEEIQKSVDKEWDILQRKVEMTKDL